MSPKWKRRCYTIRFRSSFGELTTSLPLNSILLLIAWIYFFGDFFTDCTMVYIGTSIYSKPSSPRISDDVRGQVTCIPSFLMVLRLPSNLQPR